MYRHLGLTAEGLRLIRDEEFTSRFLPVGQPEIDELIGIYNRMVDHLRDERVRVAEQHQFLSRVLQVSPSGIVILDFDGRDQQPQPGGRAAAGCRPGVHGRAASRHRSTSPLAQGARGPRARAMRSSSACSGPAGSSATTGRSSIAASRAASC